MEDHFIQGYGNLAHVTLTFMVWSILLLVDYVKKDVKDHMGGVSAHDLRLEGPIQGGCTQECFISLGQPNRSTKC